MYSQNTEQKSFGAPTSPRISFSNNLVEFIANNNARSSSHLQMIKNERYAGAAPVSSDFEFSVANSSLIMSGADELFSNGRLLPFKQHAQKNTLRDELLAQDDEEGDDFSLRPPKSSNKWKGLLGLRKSKKVDKNEEKTEEIHGTKTSQETLHGGGASIGFKG
ncbi:uncharacterized protein LOC116012067 [Ipomoea triloba]|uniref:uncharacterized protein LOC116012067 n=1 Tax=Ipomoea triloba TaxID=35885 RepID=UPI00125DFD9E|nr:uncharacterized protein LOC116012067 [Ipomoea triloba]